MCEKLQTHFANISAAFLKGINDTMLSVKNDSRLLILSTVNIGHSNTFLGSLRLLLIYFKIVPSSLLIMNIPFLAKIFFFKLLFLRQSSCRVARVQ